MTKTSKKITAGFVFIAILLVSIITPFRAQGEEEVECDWLQFQDQAGQIWLGCFIEGEEEPVEIEPLLPPVLPPVEPPVDPPVIPPVEPPAEPKPEDSVKPDKPNKPGPTGGGKPNKPGPTGGVKPVVVKPEKSEPESAVINQTPSQAPSSMDQIFSQVNFDLNRSSVKALDFPLFLLPIYQACANEYNVDWEILASINKIETRFGELNYVTSSAGAQGWMQFMPSTWEMYGTDANRDGKASPYNPVDAICSAARYLKAAGYESDVYKAIFAYNHADWYVEDVLNGAKKYQQLPKDLVSALTSLTSPSFSPVEGGSFRPLKNSKINAVVVTDKKSVGYVRAITDAKVEESGISKRFGRYIILKDQFGNRFLYAGLGKGPLPKKASKKQVSKLSKKDRARLEANHLRRSQAVNIKKGKPDKPKKQKKTKKKKTRLAPGQVLAGQKIAKINDRFGFAVRPAGNQSPWIDPTILIDNWKALEEITFAKLARKIDNKNPSLAQIFMMPKQTLAQFIINNKNLTLSECDQDYIASGMIDRRILTLMGFLANKGYQLNISSLLCGRESSITVSGNASNHSFGRGIDIASINGEPVYGNQQPGSLTEEVVLEIFNLEGLMKPDELISLFNFGPPSWSDPVDHADHIHVGYSETNSGSFINTSLDKKDWDLILGTVAKQEVRKAKKPAKKPAKKASKKKASKKQIKK